MKNVADENILLTDVVRQIRVFSRQQAKKITEQKKTQEAKREKNGFDTFFFGKYKGQKISDIAKIDKNYLLWVRRQSFCQRNLKDAITKELPHD